jgi:hypothetical protein
MRMLVLTLLLIVGSTVGGSAQQAPATAPAREEADLAPGLVPEPQVIIRAVDLASQFLFLPLLRERWVVALHGWGAFSDTASDNSVPFYMLPSLGGGNTLRGYHDYRFHDRQMLVANAESRWALFSHVEVAAFVDAGNVAGRVRDLNLDKTSYGVGLRVHSRLTTLARVDVAHSREGWLAFFKLDDPFRLARHSSRAAVVPFVP